MSVRLAKKASICLTKKDNSSMVHFLVGLGWDPIDMNESVTTKKRKGLLGLFGIKEKNEANRSENMADIDCDAAAALIGKNTYSLVFFGMRVSFDNSIIHLGDNLTGKKSDSKVIGETDDKEQITIDTSKVDKNVNEIYIGVNIYHGKERNQHFGLINNTYIRIVDANSNEELCRMDLNGKEYKNKVSMVMGRLYREADNSWNFQAIGESVDADNIKELFEKYIHGGNV